MTTLSRESHHIDRKSLRKVTGSTADFGELSRDCVGFANGAGGKLLIGIEDDADAPPASQRVDPALLDRIRKRVGELTVNVQVVPEVRLHENGGEYISLTVPRATGVALTSDGRYFLRVGDTCQPIVGDDVMRLAKERPATPWEEMTSQRVPRANADAAKVVSFCAGPRVPCVGVQVRRVVREVLIKALFNRPCTRSGDICLNLYPDRFRCDRRTHSLAGRRLPCHGEAVEEGLTDARPSRGRPVPGRDDLAVPEVQHPIPLGAVGAA